MSQNPTIKELGDRWLESSDLNDHTKAIVGCSLKAYVEQNDFWDKTDQELWNIVTNIDVARSLDILGNNTDTRFVDLKEIPLSKWDEYEYHHIIVPQHVWDEMRKIGRNITEEQLCAFAARIEEYYGFNDRYYLTPIFKPPYNFTIMVDKSVPNP